jgi:hypothetical protein
MMGVISKNRVKVCYAKGCNAEFETEKPARMYCNSEECNVARVAAKKLERKTLRERGADGKFKSTAITGRGVTG